MIRAEKAQRIMQRYEDDYDNFLDKLKAKRKAKKEAAAAKKSEADKADKTVAEAEGRKKGFLKEKAQNLLDKTGGFEGATHTVQNVMKYFKDDTPSDYDINTGGMEGYSKEEKTILGLPPMAVYAGGALLLLAGVYGLSKLLKKKNTPVQAQLPATALAEPVLKAA